MGEPNLFQILFYFILIIGITIVVLDFLMRVGGARCHAWYRRTVSSIFNSVRRQIGRFFSWIWDEHWKFIIGAVVGALAALYVTGHLG